MTYDLQYATIVATYEIRDFRQPTPPSSESPPQGVVGALNAFAQAAGETTPTADTATGLGW